MKPTIIALSASLAVLSLSANAFAQSTGTAGQTGGGGKNNTIEEQTGKATSDAPGSMNPDDIKSDDVTGSIPKSTPDNRAKSPMGTDDPSGPTVK